MLCNVKVLYLLHSIPLHNERQETTLILNLLNADDCVDGHNDDVDDNKCVYGIVISFPSPKHSYNKRINIYNTINPPHKNIKHK